MSTRCMQLRTTAIDHGIKPARCARCGQTENNWRIGHDDGRDPNWVGYQCCGCGHVQGLTRRTIVRRAKAAQA